jgi:hypothetical protein
VDENDRFELRREQEPTNLAAPVAPRRGLAAPIVSALGAAVVGGLVWALIVKSTDYEVGIVAWGIGWMTGTVAVLAARNRQGRDLQAVAVVAALLGVLVGKYLGYALVVQEDAERLGFELGIFSAEMRDFFREDLGGVFGLFDLLWVALAVFTAWRIPRPERPAPGEAV